MSSDPAVPAVPAITELNHTRPPRRALRSLVAPSFDDLGGKGTILVPLATLTLLSLATAAVVAPLLTEGPVAGPLIWGFAALTPALELAKSVILAGIAWAILVLLSVSPSFRALLSGILYGEIILSLQGVALAGLARVLGLTPGGSVISIGLDAWIPATHPVLHALAAGVTPFHAVWAAFLVPALAVAGRTTKVNSGLAVLVLWAFIVGLGMVRAFFMA